MIEPGDVVGVVREEAHFHEWRHRAEIARNVQHSSC